MIPMSLAQIADVTGGTVVGDGGIVVDGAATLDSRAVEPGGLFVAIAGEHADGHDFTARAVEAGAAGVLASRDTGVPGVIVPDATRALGVLARHVLDEREDVQVVAMTGSSGKTSVKDLIAHLLAPEGATVATRGNHNNELGVPLTVLQVDELTRFLVVEMGARAIGDIAALCEIAPPDIGMVLNVGLAHVGEFGSADRIAVAKGEMAESTGPDGVVVLNADDPRVSAMVSRTRASVTTFGTTGDVRVGAVRLDDDGSPHFTLSHHGRSVEAHVPLIGDYHAMNAAAAAAAALSLGVDLETIAARLATADTARSPMRMERHVRADGLVVINDAYNANPQSMAASLRAVAAISRGRGVAVLGPMFELGEQSDAEHRRIGRLAADLGFTRVVVVGAEASAIADGAGDIAELVDDADVATRTLPASLSGDEVVLVKASRGARLERVSQALVQA
ncbi:UDP-N-acetylmuramoyl-tripeptide--D-alanyl-D-alanine ligase [Aeromicrobium wangtongii]|uniref:UDP-N-acetylmuramoyl-tripeptide--D-alanyl-D-alanine ligase n=1 Tax=Aeromicrobium wangtongii TaxID=2969247 RepID=A0ABY5MA94_9ACTN|nr:UDP-N-acetylmuramoyl-tripeptide--D-alanyl-D-alanine ligase [Aeromicrobium wangtongii]MCD9197546.1 UDP-N-acetylmuramoyl-tripeptide--D-alanyl-D-alanine ligase [Aeromicrobium wangtongii]UUP15038.1 UDP-N-acetylmuramoyl-tripeptide--D-alanyl-D-alanine ligase [Aeromicrobium wangtongii]